MPGLVVVIAEPSQLVKLGLLLFPGLLEGTCWVLTEQPKLSGERDLDRVRCGAGNSTSGETGSNWSMNRLKRLNCPTSASSPRVVVSVSVSVSMCVSLRS
jgi:hypothetical protein